jgi:hypothetical protein
MPPIRGFSVYNENFQGSDYTAAEWEFVAAVAAYQKRWGRRFPSWREAFNILVALGYRKVAPPTALPRMTDAEREVVAQARKLFDDATGAPPTPPGAPAPG